MKSNNYREELSKEVEVLLYNFSDTVEKLISGHLLYEFISNNKMRLGQGLMCFLTPLESPAIYYCEDDGLLLDIITEHLSNIDE